MYCKNCGKEVHPQARDLDALDPRPLAGSNVRRDGVAARGVDDIHRPDNPEDARAGPDVSGDEGCVSRHVPRAVVVPLRDCLLGGCRGDDDRPPVGHRAGLPAPQPAADRPERLAG